MRLLKFSADWCQSCKQLTKHLDKKEIFYEEINVDDENNEELVEKYNIKSIPTLVLIKEDGSTITTLYDSMPVSDIIKVLIDYKYLDESYLTK